MVSSSNSFPVVFERDPENQKLENDLNILFNNVLKEEESINPTTYIEKKSTLQSFSYEDAIRELAEMKKNTNIS